MNKLTLELPCEFIGKCEFDHVSPERVLKGFIADLCHLINTNAHPRYDGYASNGKDERRLAGEYYAQAGYPYFDPMDKI
jgi:hypothetical protein